jgi:hypothetical protein
MRHTILIAALVAACSSGAELQQSRDADVVDGVIVADAGVDSLSIDGATAVPSACAIPTRALHAWTLDIAVGSAFKTQADVLYTVDRRSQLLSTTYTRVAYCLQLDSTFMYVEVDDFTGGQIADTGIPTESVFKVSVTNLTLRTSAQGIANATNASGGGIELWPNCYSEGTNAAYDYNDAVTAGTDCYGSFQIHHDTTTLLAYNHWSGGTGADDLGIGNQAQGNLDWTFAANADTYTVRRLQAFVIPSP